MGQALRKQDDKEYKYYMDITHSNSKGWITRAEINSEFKQWHFKYQELLKQNFKKDNVYISLNTFYSTFRRIEFLKELKAQFIDLDVYKTKFTKNQILMNLDNNYFNKSIPRPNIIIDSGRGLYLIWIINSVPSKALPLWKAVEEYLYSVLKPFGADRKALDPTRVLRVPGSFNTKSNTKVEIIEEYDYIYDLREIQSEFLPELDEKKPKKRGRPSKTVFIHRERSLYYARIQDIIKLCELIIIDLLPLDTSSNIILRTFSFNIGSNPEVGSSKTNNSAFKEKATIKLTLIFMPLDNCRNLLLRGILNSLLIL